MPGILGRMNTPGRCRIEAELRLPAHWTAAEVVTGRLAGVAGQSGDTIAARMVAEVWAARPPGQDGPEVLAFAALTRAEREAVSRRLDDTLALDPVRREEARAYGVAADALATVQRRTAAEGLRLAEAAITARARAAELPGAEEPVWRRWIADVRGQPRRPAASGRQHLSLRLGYTLTGDIVALRRAVERDRPMLAQAGELAWFDPRFEDRRQRRRESQGNEAPGALPLPPLGARLVSLLREVAACLRAEDCDAAFTVARAFAVFAQSQPDVTRLLMRDPRSARLGDGFAADEPADVDFELQKTLRSLQARHNLGGLRDMFCDVEPRLGVLRIIEARVRAEAEGNASPFHAGAFARVFGDADQALRHWEAMVAAGLVLAPRTPAPPDAPPAAVATHSVLRRREPVEGEMAVPG